MVSYIAQIRYSLVLKLILIAGATLLLSLSVWSYYNIQYQKKKALNNIIISSDNLSNTINLGTHYAMMLNSREDIDRIVKNMGQQNLLETIRIYNKAGRIKFSSRTSEVDRTTNIKSEACYICHRMDPPLSQLGLEERVRIFRSSKGTRLLGIISPIYNERGCSTAACHVHPSDQAVLGALDLVVSLEEHDKATAVFRKRNIAFAVSVFFITSSVILVYVLISVNRPIRKIIEGTRFIAKGQYSSELDIDRENEIGQLAAAINQMGREIGEKQAELNKQRDQYQNLFEHVPCIITVQDRNYNLVGYNREFAEKFNPRPGDFCYYAYKGRSEKCENCPVEKTFEDGRPHFSEEVGFNKDGTVKHWVVRTSPIKDADGEIVAAMEMCLDVTQTKKLQEQLEKYEKKYCAIFNNIPNAVFVLDMDTLGILDCNESVKAIYGYDKEEIMQFSFLDLFSAEDRDRYAARIRKTLVMNQIRHIDKKGNPLYVDIRISPFDYPDRKVLLATTSDVTKRLETEQQLIQASKMATLGEMATGIAHELNQPLSVIKTASSFLMKKVKKKEPIKEDILFTMASEIDGHVDRATKIINHMREFGRKSDMILEPVRINDIIRKAFEIFSQQLKIREIEVVWELEDNLPEIMADPYRLEQVFINLLINARDAIEDRWELQAGYNNDKRITLTSKLIKRNVVVEVSDTGTGIPETVIKKIFEPFFTTKKVGKGTGLGLSISYGIVKDCGGSIKALSLKNKGACFVLTFPVPDKT